MRGFGTDFSFYRVTMRIRRSGLWRVFVLPDGSHAAGVSPPVRIRVR
jgi:hypothetical protein